MGDILPNSLMQELRDLLDNQYSAAMYFYEETSGMKELGDYKTWMITDIIEDDIECQKSI